MKITFILPGIGKHTPGGGAKLVFEYANRIVRLGHNVNIVFPKHLNSTTSELKETFVKWKLAFSKTQRPKWFNIDKQVKLKRVPNLKEKFIPDADVVIATAWETAQFVNDYPHKKGKKFYLFMHYERLPNNIHKENIDYFTFKLPLQKIVISSCLQQILKERYNEESILINTAVSLEKFYKENCTLSDKGKRICMFYNNAIWKGSEDGFKAFELAKSHSDDLKLIVVGNQTKKNPREDIIAEYHFRPNDDALRKTFNSCSIFLSPNLREGFGLPAAEAMACGCALVTTDSCGCRDYAIHNKTALVSNPGDVKTLSKHIKILLDNPSLRNMLSINGYNYIRQFSLDTSAIKLLNILNL